MYPWFILATIPGLLVVVILVLLFQTKGNRIADLVENNKVADLNALKVEIEKNKLTISTANVHVGLLLAGMLLALALPVSYIVVQTVYAPQTLRLTAKIDPQHIDDGRFYVQGPQTLMANDQFAVPILRKSDSIAINVQSTNKFVGLTINGILDIDAGYFEITSPASWRRRVPIEVNSIDLTQFDDLVITLKQSPNVINNTEATNQPSSGRSNKIDTSKL